MAKKSHREPEKEYVSVFRVEHADGSGIYRHPKCDIWKKVTNDFEDLSCHPLPHHDKALRYDDLFDRDCHFGFESVEDYKHWFFNPHWRKQLSKYGITLSLYLAEFEFVRKGTGQLIFRKDKAILKERFDPFHFK